MSYHVRVRSLKELSIRKIYSEIHSEIEVIFEKKKKTSKFFSKCVRFVKNLIINSSEEKKNSALKAIRDNLDAQLAQCNLLDTLLADELMDQLVKLFVSNYSNTAQAQVNYSFIFAFFKCVLDENITSFDLTAEESNHPFQHIDSDELLQVISQQSPFLHTLRLSLRIAPTFQNILSFKCLTSLTISPLASRGFWWILFFSALGESCPQLTFLEFGGNIHFEGMLNLALGGNYREDYGELGILLTDVDLHRLQFSDQQLSSITKTLKHLKIKNFPFKGEKAFVLRHFRQLQSFETNNNFCHVDAIVLLKQQSNAPRRLPESYVTSRLPWSYLNLLTNGSFEGKLSTSLY